MNVKYFQFTKKYSLTECQISEILLFQGHILEVT